MRYGLSIIFTLLFLPVFITTAQESSAQNTKKNNIDHLAWLSGHWVNTSDKVMTEEFWLPPRGGLMLGLNRTVSPKGKASFEYLRIVEKDASIVYLASPGGGVTTAFTLSESSAHHVVFENIKHDFPQKIRYTLKKGTLDVKIEGIIQGKPKSYEWKFRSERH